MTGGLFGGFMMCYVATRVDVLVQTPLRSCIMSLYLLNRMIENMRHPMHDGLTFLKLLGTVTPMPVMLTDDECEGEEHDDCAVCLGKLCTSVNAVSLVAAARQRCRPSLSMCRLREKLRPHDACVDFSAMRMSGLDFCKQNLSGMWGRMTTLPCGHKFHAACIHDAAISKLQCPTCRGALGDDWADVPPEQKLLYKIGLCAIAVFYAVVYLWHWWILRQSTSDLIEPPLSNVTENASVTYAARHEDF